MIKEKLIEKFGKIINHMSCVYLGDGEGVLNHFLEKCKPIDTAIEIGTYQGVSAAVIAQHVDKLYTFDVVDKLLKNDIWEYLDIRNIVFKLVKDNEEKRKEIEKINADFVFIDGEHFDGKLINDFEMTKHVKYILIHDYSPHFHEVYNFCNNVEGFEKEIKGSFCLLTKKDNYNDFVEKIVTPGEKAKNELLKRGIDVKPKKRRGRKKKSESSTYTG